MQFRVERVVGVQQARQVVGAHAGKVDLVVLVHDHRGAAAQDHVHAVDVGRPQVVVLVALQDEQLADVVLGQPEGPGAVGLVEP